MSRQSPRPMSSIPGQSADTADSPKGRPGIGSQVAMISALIFAVLGVSLVAVLVVGLVEGVRGLGPLLLAALAVGVFGLAFRLLMVSRNLRARAAVVRPARQVAPRQAVQRRRPQPRPVTRRR